MTEIDRRARSAARLAADNDVLSVGTIVIEDDTGRAKRHNGASRWNDLPYWVDPTVPFFAASGNSAADLTAAYSAAVAAGGGTVYLPKGTYSYDTDLDWTSNLVSILGAGKGDVFLQAVGTAKIVARPNPFTISPAPQFSGFTVRGDPAAPAGAIGIYTGDITGSRWDIVVENFSGVGSVGVDIDNAATPNAQTERNDFRFRLDNNKIGLRCRRSGPAGMFSFGYNDWNLEFLVNDGQTGWLTQDDVLLYHNDVRVRGNMVDTGDLIDVSGTSEFVQCRVFITAEQTSGTGAVGVRKRDGASWSVIGHRSYNGTMEDVNESALTEGGTFAPSLRQLAGIARIGNQLMTMDAGVKPDFLGTEDADMVPVIADQLDALYGSFGFLTGAAIISPFVSMLNVAGNGVVFYAVPVSGTLGEAIEVGRLTAEGTLILPEQADPAAPAANKAIWFVRDNGAGKTQACVRFPTGAIKVLATED